MDKEEQKFFELHSYDLVTKTCSLPSKVIDIKSVTVDKQRLSLKGSTLVVQFSLNGTTKQKQKPQKSAFEDKVVTCFENKYDQFTGKFNSVTAFFGDRNSVEAPIPSTFPTLIVIISGCSFVAILALLSVYFISKRPANTNRQTVRVVRNRQQMEMSRDLVELEDDTLDGHGIATEMKSSHPPHEGGTPQRMFTLDNVSSGATSHSDSKVLNDLEMQKIQIDINPTVNDVGYSDSNGQKHSGKLTVSGIINNSPTNVNANKFPKGEVKGMQVLSPLARQYDVGSPFDGDTGGNNNTKDLNSVTGSQSPYMKAHADSGTIHSMRETTDPSYHLENKFDRSLEQYSHSTGGMGNIQEYDYHHVSSY